VLQFRRNEEKSNTIQPPSCVFLTFNWYLEHWSVVLTLYSVTEKDLGDTSSFGSGHNNNNVPYDYGENKKSSIGKIPKFNGDAEEFSWWKTNFYSSVMSLDEELWDILEEGVGDLVLDEEGAVVDRKKHTPAQKKLYKKHHIIRGTLVTAIPKAE
jgi:hypothetical protein